MTTQAHLKETGPRNAIERNNGTSRILDHELQGRELDSLRAELVLFVFSRVSLRPERAVREASRFPVDPGRLGRITGAQCADRAETCCGAIGQH